MDYFNDEIECCGLKYIGHFNRPIVQLCGKSWGIEIPIRRVGEFTNLFPDVDWENGAFLDVLKGRYIRVCTNKIGRIYSLKHITKEIEYLVDKQGE